MGEHRPLNPETLIAHHAFVRKIVRRLLSDETCVDDVVQQTWVTALNTPPRHAGALRTWLARVSHRFALREIRGRQRRDQRERAVARPESVPSSEDVVAKLEWHRKVVEAVFHLREPHRSTIILRFYEEMSPGEIARRCGVTVATVRNRTLRAFELLREQLDRDHDGNRKAWSLALLPLAASRNDPVRMTRSAAASMKSRLILSASCLVVLIGATYLVASNMDRGYGRTDRGARSIAPEPLEPIEPTQETVALPDSSPVDRDRDLHGVVVRKSDGTAVPGATLNVVTYPWQRTSSLNQRGHWEEEPGPRTVSATDGTFRLRLRPGALVSLRVRAPGYAPLEYAKRQAGECVRVELVEHVQVAVHVRDDSKQPVVGASITLWGLDHRGSPCFLRRGVADAEGRCVVQDLPSNADVVLAAGHPRLGTTGILRTQLPVTGVLDEVLTFPRGRPLSGTVIDAATREPIEGANVGMNWTLSNPTRTTADGRFTLPGWTGKGVIDVYAVAPDYGRARLRVGTKTTLVFELQVGDSVAGRILGANRAPVAGVRVSAVGSRDVASSFDFGRSDTEGRFLLRGLRRDGLHTLVVTASGHGRYLLDFSPHPDQAGRIDLGDIVLPGPQTIAGRVVNAEGKPLQDVAVTLRGHNRDRTRLLEPGVVPSSAYHGVSESRYTDDIGRFRFPDLSPGQYTVFITTADGRRTQRELDLKDERDLRNVDIQLSPARRFVVLVTDTEKRPAADIIVSVRTRTNAHGEQTNAAGRAVFSVASPVLHVYARRAASCRHKFIARDFPVSGDPNELTIVLEAARTISGKVLSPDGTPLSGARLRVDRAGARVAGAKTSDSGDFEAEVPGQGPVAVVLLGDLEARVEGVALGSTGVTLRARHVTQDGLLTIKVVEPDDTPVEGARVFVIPGRKQATTNKHGEAKLVGLPIREITVYAFQPSSRTGLVAPRPRRVLPTIEGAEVVLRLRPAVTITGQVVNPDGTAAGSVNVELRKSGRIHARTTTDDLGRFAISVAADESGPWAVVSRSSGGASREGRVEKVHTGAAGVRVQLK